MQDLIVIGRIGIRQDGGLYCLNDLHRAAGGEDRHSPRRWTDLQQTAELIQELEIDGKPSILSKQGLGTFACRELVYAYAMWISPRFHLAVIRAFDAIQAAPKVPQTLPEALRLAADLAEQNQAQAQRLAVAEPKAAALDLLSAAEGGQTVTNAAKILKIAPKKLFAWLSEKRWIYKRGGKGAWIGYQDKVQSGHITHGEHRYTRSNGEQQLVAQVYLTPKGIAKISEEFAKGAAA